MKKLILFISILFISLASFGQRYTLKESVNSGFFSLNDIDYPKNQFGLKYDNIAGGENGMNFTIYNVFTGDKLISSRHYSEVANVANWDELRQLIDLLGLLAGESLATGGGTLAPYELAVNQGKVFGVSSVDKFGLNPLISTTTDPEDVWERGGLYPYDTFGTAPILYLSSSDNGDTQPVKITGLDIDGNEVEQTITLTGQTNANLTTALWRVYRMENEGTADLAGTVYCHTDPTPASGVPANANIRAEIDNGNNQTLMSLYTIPKGKVGFLYRGEAGIEYSAQSASQNVEFAAIYYNSRRVGKVFKIKKVISLITSGNSNYSDPRSFPDIVPSLTDIKITVKEVSNDMGIWATFDILLVDEGLFPLSYLQAIGQPGY